MDVGVLDIFVIVSLLYSIFQGFTKGLIISLASLAGLILGIWGGMKFSNIATTFIEEQWGINFSILSFTVTFLTILLGVYFLGKLLEKVVSILALGLVNKIGGALFSTVKMSLILTVLFTIVNQVNVQHQLFNPAHFTSAYSYPYLQMLEVNILPFVKDLISLSSYTSI